VLGSPHPSMRSPFVAAALGLSLGEAGVAASAASGAELSWWASCAAALGSAAVMLACAIPLLWGLDLLLRPGPLAGVLTALQRLATEFLVTVPCDAPLVAPDLVGRLYDACVANNADVAVATDGRRQQPVFLLLRAGTAPSLEAYLSGGGRKIDTWFAGLRLAEADLSDALDTFVNVNDPDERQRLEARLLSTAGSR